MLNVYFDTRISVLNFFNCNFFGTKPFFSQNGEKWQSRKSLVNFFVRIDYNVSNSILKRKSRNRKFFPLQSWEKR